jgi:hypothetical protein
MVTACLEESGHIFRRKWVILRSARPVPHLLFQFPVAKPEGFIIFTLSVPQLGIEAHEFAPPLLSVPNIILLLIKIKRA